MLALPKMLKVDEGQASHREGAAALARKYEGAAGGRPSPREGYHGEAVQVWEV